MDAAASWTASDAAQRSRRFAGRVRSEAGSGGRIRSLQTNAPLQSGVEPQKTAAHPMERGGKRSATPLWNRWHGPRALNNDRGVERAVHSRFSAIPAPQRRRRFALPPHSRTTGELQHATTFPVRLRASPCLGLNPRITFQLTRSIPRSSGLRPRNSSADRRRPPPRGRDARHRRTTPPTGRWRR